MVQRRQRNDGVRLNCNLLKRATVAVTDAKELVLVRAWVAESEEFRHGNVFVEIERVPVDHELRRLGDVHVWWW